MITLNGFRNGLLCVVAFGIVGCASTPLSVEKLAVAKPSVDRAEQAHFVGQAIPGRPAAGSP